MINFLANIFLAILSLFPQRAVAVAPPISEQVEVREIEEVNRANALRTMLNESQGYLYLIEHINSEIQFGWEKFIDMPVDKKTSKTAYDFQARYKVLKDLKDWIAECINLGDQAERMRDRATTPMGLAQ